MATTLEAWTKAKVHEVTLPSGTEVQIKIPNLPMLVKTGQLPNELLESASKMADARKITPELMAQQVEYTSYLVSITVVEPKISPADVADLPFEDQEMIVEFALRNRDMDAVGHHLAGLETVQSFRDLRGFLGSE